VPLTLAVGALHTRFLQYRHCLQDSYSTALHTRRATQAHHMSMRMRMWSQMTERGMPVQDARATAQLLPPADGKKDSVTSKCLLRSLEGRDVGLTVG
jgi:hypothetical protein